MAISNNNVGVRTGVCTSSTRPTAPYEGQTIYETDTDLTYIWGGSVWQQVSGGTAVGNSGLVYVTSATVGTAVSSVTVSSAFSSTYDNYKIIYSGGTNSAIASLALTIGGSTTGYYGVLFYSTSGVASPLAAGTNNGSSLPYVGGCNIANQAVIADFDLLNPFAAAYSRIVGAQYSDGAFFGTTQGEHRVATSYSSFALFPASGTLTGGTITVYGYRKA